MNRLARGFVAAVALAAVSGFLGFETPLEAQTPACGWTIRIHADNVSTVSGAEALAFDDVTNSLFVKSLLDPSGTNIQLTQILSDGSFSIGPTYPGLRNSDLSGIAMDPLVRGIIVADEIGGSGGRITRANLSTFAVSTLFDVPWVMNVKSNGTGQQQYAADDSSLNVLYFWDSTLSKLFHLSRSTNNLVELLALDQGTPVGQHISTFTNDLVFDPTTVTLLLSDGSSNSILQVDPSTSPPTVTTLFAGLPGRPAALTLNPLADFVFVVIGFNTVWAGQKSGSSLSPIATGFNFLTDIVGGRPASGTVFGADKALDRIYAITPLAQALTNLLAEVDSADIPHGIKNALTAKLSAAISAFDRGANNAGVNILEAFQHAVSAQSGKSIDPVTSAHWIAAAQAIIDGAAACS